MVEAGYAVAFLGGVLSLLSPCSALLLPAFFAYAFGGAGRLVRRTGAFYLGLAATLVPLGTGIAAVSSLFYGQRGALITASGLVLISLGILQALGGGLSFGPLGRLTGRIKGRSVASIFALGAVYGFAGFCSGPILGSVLTVAAASGGMARGATLLAVYALGMALPLFLMALLWDRLDLGSRRWLRGRELVVGRSRLHTTNLVSGAMFVILGVMFVAYEGTSALSGLYESNGATDLAFAAQVRASSIPDWTAYGAGTALFLVVAAWLLQRYRRTHRGSPGRNASAKAEEGTARDARL